MVGSLSRGIKEVVEEAFTCISEELPMATKSLPDGDNFCVLGTVKDENVVNEIKDIFTMTKQERFNKMAQEIRKELGFKESGGAAVVPMRVIK